MIYNRLDWVEDIAVYSPACFSMPILLINLMADNHLFFRPLRESSHEIGEVKISPKLFIKIAMSVPEFSNFAHGLEGVIAGKVARGKDKVYVIVYADSMKEIPIVLEYTVFWNSLGYRQCTILSDSYEKYKEYFGEAYDSDEH